MNKIYNISIVGQSNTGKSTLTNYLSKSYISSANKKAQTTRATLNVLTNIKDLNVMILDTPGVTINNNDLLSTSMKNSYIKSLEHLDLLILLLDIYNNNLKYEDTIIKLCESSGILIIPVINKIDKLHTNDKNVKKLRDNLIKEYGFEPIMISLLSEKGINILINEIVHRLSSMTPKSKTLVDKKSNQKVSIQEIIQGVIIDKTHGEVPYDSATHIQSIENKKKIINLIANIYVEKDNHKKILIGKEGHMIKEIGIASRKILEKIYNKKIFLNLKVVVKHNWKNNYELLKELGYI